ncbi:putative monooxygenase [Saccharata proteae CBS 121410]|uniref:Monooxygenase n=1 Tax=Saccharata proteae CBS 121410 TaxID=1314787 RepID=A0A9P4HTE5_9PEZI|nr:putative monooxygenase [Saccharata proteae CBS 121410]
MTMKVEHTDLTIVGAGPTGLLIALLARSLGLSVFIADKAPTLLQVGRADALNARTQQTLELIRVLEELEPQGLKCNTSSTYSNGAFISRQNQWWTSLEHCHRPNFLMIGQSDIEKVLNSRLDIPVHHGYEALDITECTEDGEDCVRTTFKDRIVVSKYAVGADGARSLVRQKLQIPFEGDKPNMIWHVLDTFLDTDFPVCPEIITFQVDGQARVSWIPRERGMARFYVLLDDGTTRAGQAQVEDEIRKFMEPHRVDFKATEWFSTFEVKERVARTYFSPNKRIMLAGDAAHVHAVNGGQGLNTGVADAFALSWRLKLAVSGLPEILESYESERRASAVEVINVAAKLVRSTVKTATEYVQLIERNAGYITGMGVNYPLGSQVVQGKASGIFVPGHRTPDVYLHCRKSGETKRLYTLVSYGKFIVLSLKGISWTPPTTASEYVETWYVSEAVDSPASEPTNAFARMTADGADAAVDVGNEEFIVIRPDMYTGYGGSDVSSYFEGIFH